MIQIRYFILVFALLGASCGGNGFGDRQHTPTRYRLFFDVSNSVRDRQKSTWPQDAIRAVGGLQYGDAIDISLIHARTSDAEPLFRGEIPPINETSTLSDRQKAKRELTRVRNGAKQAIGQAIHPSRNMHVNATDVFGIFEHRPDTNRQNVILAYTDALESVDHKLNFERSCLNGMDLDSAVRDLMDRKGWRSDQMAGANIFFVLPGVDSNDAENCNDSGQLRAFYQTLARALGGNLAGFDTYWR